MHKQAEKLSSFLAMLTLAAFCLAADGTDHDHANNGNHMHSEKTESGENEADNGQKHDPPISAGEVPDGHWYCEMGGKSHWSQSKEGDGECPICGMHLKHKTDSSDGED